MTFRTFYIDNKATYALDELVAPIAKPFQSDKTGSVPEGGEAIVHMLVRADACPTCHTAMKVHTISFSCWSCLFAKVLKRRRRVAQMRASKKGAAPKYKKGAAPTLPPYLFQVQLTSLLS